MRRSCLILLGLALGACAGRGSLVVRKAAPPAPQPAALPTLEPLVQPSPSPSPAPAGKSPARKKKARPPKPGEREKSWKKVPNRAFAVGEKLSFAVQFGNITAGYAVLSIPGLVQVEGRPAFHILAETRSHPAFDPFFKVRDRIDSYLDAEYAFSWRYEKRLREGKYQADASYIFDQRAGLLREPAKGREAPLPPAAQDVLGCFYYFRTQDLSPGAEVRIPVAADDMKSYELKVQVLGRERVKTLAGDFDCLKVRPQLSFQGVFQQKGEVFVWVTDDVRRIPVKVSSKIAIGSISVILQNAEWAEPEAAKP